MRALGAALAVLALALLALPAGSGGDSSNPTWAGTWESDFGRMTLDAGGSGSYESPFGPNSSGTISGNVDGRVNRGTWKQPNSSGKFVFTMSGDGLSFTGDWEYDQGGCGSSCGWNGECKAGPCLENDEPAESTKCASGGSNAFAALTRVDLCDGSRTTVRAPADEPVIFLPEPMPDKATALEVFTALRELALQEEAEELAAAMELRAKNVEEANQFKGCLLLGDELLGQAIPKYLTVNERRIALFKACQRMLLAETKKGADDKKRARSAARGCNAVFVPVFPKGRKVTKRMLERARAAERRQIAASCSDRTGKLSISVRARGDKKLPAIIGRRLPTAVTHREPNATADGPDRDLTARLRVRKG